MDNNVDCSGKGGKVGLIAFCVPFWIIDNLLPQTYASVNYRSGFATSKKSWYDPIQVRVKIPFTCADRTGDKAVNIANLAKWKDLEPCSIYNSARCTSSVCHRFDDLTRQHLCKPKAGFPNDFMCDRDSDCEKNRVCA